MSQVNKELTISQTNKANGEHWVVTNEMDKADIDSIVDPEGGKTVEMPTSIPSPFARLDLVRAAFANAYRLKEKASPNDLKLVSEALDIAQIFFNYENLKSKISIVRWDRNKGIDALLRSSSKGHNNLGNALQLFLDQDGGKGKIIAEDQDSGGYNFDYMDSIFIIKYHDDEWSGIIGGTSPSTLFFSSPGNLGNVNIRFNNDILFDDEPLPLHLREENFQRFIYGICKLPNFSDHFKEVFDYIQYSTKELAHTNRILHKEIGDNCDAITRKYVEEKFEGLFLDNGDVVEILRGFRVRKAPSDIEQLKKSDFILNTDKFRQKYSDSLIPMILQDNYHGRLKYIGDFWDKNQVVSSYDPIDWHTGKRCLPGQEVNYPYLTVSDFLEPYLIRLVYPIDKTSFFNGGLQGTLTKNYLIPLKPDFFDFFDVSELLTPGGRVNLQMEVLAGENVKVRLSINLKQGEPPIVFERIYKSSINDYPLIPESSKRDGGSVVELQFGLNIMPFIKITNTDFPPLYKIQVADRNVSQSTYSGNFKLEFYDRNNEKLEIGAPKTRRTKELEKDTLETIYYTSNKNFDYIMTEFGVYRGLIIPKFPEQKIGLDEYTFAVDLGTTNSHVEYMVNNKVEELSISDSDKLIATLHDRNFADRSFNNTGATLISLITETEWLPFNIGKGNIHKFPMRTVIVDNQPNWNSKIESYADTNPGYDYLNRAYRDPSYRITSNLKWLDIKEVNKDKGGEQKVASFIEALLFKIRNKVLLSGGNLEETKLIWFYPQSMDPNRLSSFSRIWEEKYNFLITNKYTPHRISESIAPYHGYRDGNKIQSNLHPAVTIDIGGGTTDYAVYFEKTNDEIRDDKKPKSPVLITSMRFAANAVFADNDRTKSGVDPDNGFVAKYGREIRQQLESLKLSNLIEVFDKIRNTEKSEDLVSFFFSLKDNPDVKERGDIDFEKLLTDDYAMKIVFLVFYCAIIYHLAKVMKTKGLPMPRDIAFSGNGSKLLSVLSPRNPSIEDIAQSIFNKVYKEERSTYIKIVKSINPKEVTCKGGIEYVFNEKVKFENIDERAEDEIAKLKIVLKGTKTDVFVGSTDKYKNIYRDLDSIENEVSDFYDLLFDLNDVLNFKNKLGVNISDLEAYRQILKRDIRQQLLNGIDRKLNEVSTEDTLEETIFFYPISYGIQALASTIARPKADTLS